MESRIDYYTKLEQVISFIVDTELSQICGVNVANLRKIKALISIICSTVPFELDAKKLAGAIEVSRDTVIEYLQDLDKADQKTPELIQDEDFRISIRYRNI